MVSVTLKADVFAEESTDFTFEFGRVQAGMWMSKKGKAAKALKLQEGDVLEITIKKK